MYLGRHELDLEDATIGREWLLTNGRGGFASSTLGGLNTRRYHGWLVANVARYGGRFVVLANLEEELRLDGRTFHLATSPGAGPEAGGYRHLQGFALSDLPVFIYYAGGFFFERTLAMPRGENQIVAVYRLAGPLRTTLDLTLKPLVTFRFYHHILRANDWPFRTEAGPDWVTVQPHAGSPVLVFRHAPEAVWEREGYWRYGFDYVVEERRGLDHVEDLFAPGRLTFRGLGAGAEVALSAALAEDEDEARRLLAEPFRLETALEVQAREAQRQRDLVAGAWQAIRDTARAAGRELEPGDGEARSFLEHLVRATDAFVAVRGGSVRDGQARDAGRRTTVIAGYPWFEDWGRDTLIALPGLFLLPGRRAAALEVLADYASFVRDGLVPNRFPDQATDPDYNTVDASLWLFWAAQAYAAYAGVTGRRRALGQIREALLGPLREIATRYREGTRFGIGEGTDGLIHAGEPGVAVTWMDAKLGDWVVTPRRGCPVEINALWYNALRFLAELEGEERSGGDPGDPGPGRGQWTDLAARVRRAFNARFWNPARGCLYDVVPSAGTDEPPDPSVRPNQILAVALPYPVLDPGRWRAVVDVCFRDLYATYGLRTLSPDDPAYHGLYRGGPDERDGAYHQGTSWPWLLGPFLVALRRATGDETLSRALAARLLRPFERHLREAGVGYISEVFDGDFPYRPGGCIAQAWSVAEILRAWVEEVLGVRPPGWNEGEHETGRVGGVGLARSHT